MNTPKAIIIAAGILAIAILISTRFDRMASGNFIVHDRWTGRITHCFLTTRPPGRPGTKENRWYCDASGTAGPAPIFWLW